MTRGLAPVAFPALGTTAVMLVTDAAASPGARAVLEAEIGAIDQACSRFREDSELQRLNHRSGEAVGASPLLLDAIDVALRAARVTGGLVDPTVGTAMRVIGYDRPFRDVAREGEAIRVSIGPVPGWRLIEVDRLRRTVRIPPGVELDLGATAKALCADRAAEAIYRATGAGVLVGLGGDIATAGPAPDGGWSVLVADDHAVTPDGPGEAVAISSGGVATSGTAVRRWARGGRPLHHLIDPSTGLPTDSNWRTVSVAAATCVDANIASTAAVILGDEAPSWLAARALPARLVRSDGMVLTVGGWPVPEARC